MTSKTAQWHVVLNDLLDAELAKQVAEHVADGCWQSKLGAVTMPAGYALMVNADGSHYYGLKHDGTETGIHCDKWVIYRWTKRDACQAPNAQVKGAPGTGVEP